MQTQQTQNSFPGPQRYRDFREQAPGNVARERSRWLLSTLDFRW